VALEVLDGSVVALLDLRKEHPHREEIRHHVTHAQESPECVRQCVPLPQCLI
jgi:hypothetical protein